MNETWALLPVWISLPVTESEGRVHFLDVHSLNEISAFPILNYLMGLITSTEQEDLISTDSIVGTPN